MTDLPLAAGYIVTDNELICGFGRTADEAQQDAVWTAEAARIDLSPDHLMLRAASNGLLTTLETMGGVSAWFDRAGVACTREEWEA